MSQSFWRHAERHPDALALVTPDGREHTAGELLAECNRVVHGLRALGLSRGDCIATVLPNGLEMIALELAALQAGLYITPINHHLTGSEIAYIVGDAEAKAFFGHERFAAACTAATRRARLATRSRAVSKLDSTNRPKSRRSASSWP